MSALRRISAGIYETSDGKARIERVSREARNAGYRDGWNPSVDGEYWQTFGTRKYALDTYLAHMKDAP